MKLILTMAGKYSRFVNEGYKFPKYLLPWGEKQILGELIREFACNFDDIYFIANKADIAYMPHVRKLLDYHEINQHNLLLIDDTNSQAQTGMIALEKIDKISQFKDEIIFFHNIDTILYERDFVEMSDALKTPGGYIDVFKSNNHEYSYIISENNRVREIREKMLISDFATSGLYGFSSAQLYETYYVDGYISEIYRRMLKDGVNVSCGKIYDEKNTIVLGTPAEYLSQSNFIR